MTYSMPLYYDLTRKMKSMDRTSLNHLRNYSKAKKSTKLKQSSITGNEDEATNTMSNGGDILSPMLPGNRNILFLMMATLSHVINNDTIFKSHHNNNMHCDPHYNVNCELWEFRDHMYELREFLIDIRLALVFAERIYDITDFLYPPFDPFKTIGK
jgi:hypothetical protein